jgi:hypothetical protein
VGLVKRTVQGLFSRNKTKTALAVRRALTMGYPLPIMINARTASTDLKTLILF